MVKQCEAVTPLPGSSGLHLVGRGAGELSVGILPAAGEDSLVMLFCCSFGSEVAQVVMVSRACSCLLLAPHQSRSSSDRRRLMPYQTANMRSITCSGALSPVTQSLHAGRVLRLRADTLPPRHSNNARER
jgi:hypothetical protein